MLNTITVLNRWQALLLSFIAGAILALGFAPYHAWPVLFISLPILYLLLTHAANRAQVLWRSFFFGYGHCIAGTWWIGNALLIDADKFGWMLPFSILGLSAVMALWFVAFGALVYAFRARMTLLNFAILWLIVEVLRSLGIFGFPWNLVGYMALASLPFAQMASIIGTYGLSFLLVLLGLLPICFIHPHARRSRAASSMIAALVILSCYTYGTQRLSAPSANTETLLRIVQPDIPQEVKGTPQGQQVAAKSLGELTTAQPQTGRAPDVTIWPETAYPFTVREGIIHPLPPLKLLLTGAVRAEGFKPNVKIWNSILAMESGGGVIARYDKHQLVPFGEFVPLRSVLPLDKITPGDLDFSRGTGPKTLSVEGIPPFSPLVCYEVIFPGMAIDPSDRPHWLLNLTNDAWYGNSPGPYQHFDMARMRAIEQGLPLVRAANNGISAVIDAKGRVVRALGLYEQTYMDVLLPAPEPATIYARLTQL